ncbi:MAG: hypothetical protein CNE98_02470 [Bacteroidetes bacterium MED-G17]|nr:MAG: hypothetical protein CBB99_00610 [Bacteroidetes bacterium TMED39]PDH53006.1 MAG: hypothetical protein CNE98_02470 [Bacteroidetes bacterium MED-G17]CAI8262665.1 MAG: Uncharacterised protein [Bacteroidetes bacterium MED-G17]|tara:strand:+ start:16534 stop:16920 length:387 start_codon:yes stop_codon:yes gene_type:complete
MKNKIHSYSVQENDFPNFFGSDIHEVCSTYTLCREAEKLGRMFILPFVDEHNEGIGTFVDIQHLGPAFLHEEILFEGRIVNEDKKNFVIKFVAKVGKRTIAEGRTGQKLVNRKKMSAIFLRLKKTVEK